MWLILLLCLFIISLIQCHCCIICYPLLTAAFFLCRKLSFSFIDVAGSIVGVDVCGWWVGVGADVAGGGEHSGSVDAGAGDAGSGYDPSIK